MRYNLSLKDSPTLFLSIIYLRFICFFCWIDYEVTIFIFGIVSLAEVLSYSELFELDLTGVCSHGKEIIGIPISTENDGTQ